MRGRSFDGRGVRVEPERDDLVRVPDDGAGDGGGAREADGVPGEVRDPADSFGAVLPAWATGDAHGLDCRGVQGARSKNVTVPSSSEYSAPTTRRRPEETASSKKAWAERS